MTGKIADLIKTEIETVQANGTYLQWVDKIAGVVRAQRYTDKAGNEQVFPVAYNTPEDLCDTTTYTDLVPDSSKMSIIYFEDGGTDIIESGCMYTDCETTLKLVCWVNLKRVNVSYTDALNLKLELINNIPEDIDNTDWVTKIRVMFEGEEPKSAGLFSEYTYDESRTQYLMYPYDYFALNYKVRYSIPMNSECLSAVIINPGVC